MISWIKYSLPIYIRTHWGDLSTLWAGGWTAGRTRPLQVWGPKGASDDMGTAYAIEHFLKAYNWDAKTRNFVLSAEPGKITVHEFDYKVVNEVVYQENGVTIRSIPAIHAGDGPVSFILEYAGLKVVIGGDTFPNKWYIQHAKNADVRHPRNLPGHRRISLSSTASPRVRPLRWAR